MACVTTLAFNESAGHTHASVGAQSASVKHAALHPSKLAFTGVHNSKPQQSAFDAHSALFTPPLLSGAAAHDDGPAISHAVFGVPLTVSVARSAGVDSFAGHWRSLHDVVEDATAARPTNAMAALIVRALM